ncbi:MAG: hypothetical protein R6V35_05465 [Candidatus Nanohaloarchaea archaeon]
MKGQTTLEFVGSALFFILVILGVFTLTADQIPQFYDTTEVAEKNLEAKYLTDHLLTSNHSSESGLVNEYMHVDKDYIENDIATASSSKYNNTQLTRDLGLENRFNIRFTWYPVVETDKTFTRTYPPTIDGETVKEPSNEYSNAGNRVHYGNITLSGSEEQFLVTSDDGDYVNVYHHSDENWDFRTNPDQEGDIIDTTNAGDFRIEAIQNRPDTPGASIVLSRPIEFSDGRTYFGSSQNTTEGDVIKLTRYPVLDDPDSSNELAKMEVLVW